MGKTGIITFHRAINYGAILQTYALQRAIQNLGADCEIIDYRCEFIESQHKIFDKGSKIKSIAKLLLQGKCHWQKKKAFLTFIDQYLSLSPVCSGTGGLDHMSERYASLITGSDQVWNDICTGMDTAYFLDFVHDSGKKNSYAASFGFRKIPDGLEAKYKELLSDFNHLSVREQSGKELIQDLLHRDTEVNLDPTLLLNRQEWGEIIKCAPKFNNYILVYTVRKPDRILDAARQLAKKAHTKIIYISDNPKLKLKNPDIRFIRNASPEEFLLLFEHAKYVLTNSFHGTIFSIIFHKQFLIELNSADGQKNNRSEDLLHLLGLENRVINNGPFSGMDDSIDWKSVENILEKERRKSNGYLKSLIS